ncbi:MAG: RhuM family protein [Candidatus Cloacimonadaceae bacterium]
MLNIFESKEPERDSVSAFFASTASDNKTYNIEHYSLDAIISVGYRVHSIIGTRLRIWATERFKEYLIKGFTPDDDFDNSRPFSGRVTLWLPYWILVMMWS